MPAPETFLPSIVGSWRATSYTPGTLTALAGGQDLTTSGLSSVSDSGVAALDAAGAGSAVAASAATWKCLHDGTGTTFWTVVKPTAHGAQDALIDTGTFSSSYTGFGIWQDTVKERLYLAINNGSGVAPVLVDASWPGSWTNGARHLLVVTFSTASHPNIKVWVDGALVIECSLGVNANNGVGQSLSAGNPNYPLRLFSLQPGGSPWYGRWFESGVMSAVISSGNRAGLEAWATDTYGIAMAADTHPKLIFDGNSLQVFNGGILRPFYPENVPGELARPVRPYKSAVYGLRTGELVARYAAHVRPRFDSTRRNILVAWEIINSLGGELVSGDGGGHTKEEVYAAYVGYCQTARADGFKVVAVPPIPCGGIVQAHLDWVQAQIVANWATFADAIARVDLDPVMGSWAVQAADIGVGTYRSDGTHQTDAGGALLVPWFVAAINSLTQARGRVLVRRVS